MKIKRLVEKAESLRKVAPWLVLSFFLTLNISFLSFMIFQTFDFYDYGSFMDAAYRITCGQKPYIDFIYHIGPFFIYTLAFFFTLLGFGKAAVLAHLLTTTSIVIIFTFLTVRKYLPLFWTFLTMLLITTCFQWHYPFPCYTHDSFMWGIPGLWLLATNPFKNSKAALTVGLACGILWVISFMTKFTIGAPYGLIFFIALCFIPKRMLALAGYTIGTLAAAICFMLLIQDLPKFYSDITHYLAVQNNRVHGVISFQKWADNGYWAYIYLGMTLIILVNIFAHARKEPVRVVLFLGTVGLSYISFYLSSIDTFMITGLTLGLGMVVMEKIKPCLKSPTAITLRKISIGMLVLLALVQTGWALSFSAHRLTSYRALQPQYKIQSEPLTGWRCGYPLGKSMDDMVQYINQNVPAKDSLFIFCEGMQIIYPLTRHESYRNIPFQFWLTQLPAPGKQTDDMRDYILENLPDWIITFRQTVPFDFKINSWAFFMGLEDAILKKYTLVKTSNMLGLLKRVS